MNAWCYLIQSLDGRINRAAQNADTANPVNISIGRGISNSAIIGAVAWVNRPKRLQIPKAVPHS